MDLSTGLEVATGQTGILRRQTDVPTCTGQGTGDLRHERNRSLQRGAHNTEYAYIVLESRYVVSVITRVPAYCTRVQQETS